MSQQSINKIWRPELRSPDTFNMQVDGQMLYFIEAGLRDQVEDLRHELGQHEQYCTGPICQIRYEALITESGGIEEAMKASNTVLYDCLEDMSQIYGALAVLTGYLHKIQYLRNNPGISGDAPGLTEWRPTEKLRDITAEVVHRTNAAKTDTQTMAAVTDEPTPKKATEDSLLGLTENSKAGRKKTASATS